MPHFLRKNMTLCNPYGLFCFFKSFNYNLFHKNVYIMQGYTTYNGQLEK